MPTLEGACLCSSRIREGSHSRKPSGIKRAGAVRDPGPLTPCLLGYLSRSLALPSLSLAVPFVCSERPSAFFSLSPVTAPVASLALPFAVSTAPSAFFSLSPVTAPVASLALRFALSRAPSSLSWLLLFLPTCSFSLVCLRRMLLLYPFETVQELTLKAKGLQQLALFTELPSPEILGNLTLSCVGIC